MRRNYTPSAIIEVKGVVPLEKGGTSADNAPQALINLGLVPRFQIGEPNGPVPLTSEGLIDPSYLQGLSTATVEVDGPDNLDVGEPGTYQITNFDSRIVYKVDADFGTVSINHDVVTYETPLQPTQGTGFEINGLFFPVLTNEIVRTPDTPSITSPAGDVLANQTSQLFISSPWSTQFPEDSLGSMRWQVATDSLFEDIVVDVVQSTGNFDRYNLQNIQPGAEMFVRVAHTGFYGYTSTWSATRKFTRPPEEKPLTPTITVPAVSGDVNVQVITLTTSAFAGTAAGETHATSDIQMATDPDFINMAWSSTGDAANKISWQVTLVSRDTNYYIRVRHNGSSGWKSDWSATRMVRYVPIEKPETPNIIAPAVNGMLGNQNVTIQTSPFVGTAPSETHQATSWRFSLSSDMSNPLPMSTTSTTSLTSISVTLPIGQTVYIDVTYHGASGWSSDSSSIRSVLIDFPMQPTVLNPVNNTANVPEDVTFVSSAFLLASGGGGVSHTTIWQVASDPAFVNVVATETIVGDESDWKPGTDFSFGFSGYVRVRHISTTGQQSAYSPVVAFTVRQNNVAYRKMSVGPTVNSISQDHVLLSPSGDRLFHVQGAKTGLPSEYTSPGFDLVSEYDVSSNVFTFTRKLDPLPLAILAYLQTMVDTDPVGQLPGDPDDVFTATVTSAYMDGSGNYMHLCVRFSYADRWASNNTSYQTLLVTYNLTTGAVIDYSGTGDSVTHPNESTPYRSDFAVGGAGGFVRVATREVGETDYFYDDHNVITNLHTNLDEDYKPDPLGGLILTETEMTAQRFGSKSISQHNADRVLISDTEFVEGGATTRSIPANVVSEYQSIAATPGMIASSNDLEKIAVISRLEVGKIVLFTV